MVSSETQKKNQELQGLLQKMIQAQICTAQNAASFWQNWTKVADQKITPQQFLISLGFSDIFEETNQPTQFQPHTTTGSHTKMIRQQQNSIRTEKLLQMFGNYQIIEEIARGGMGIVYKVYQPEMKRYGALKVLLNSGTTDTSLIRRFFREAKVTAALQHPNIIPIYDMGNANNKHYFVMKYIEGGSFDSFMKKQSSWEPSLNILIKVCEALAHAHKNKVLHRDIKPSNILIDENDNPYIADFGLAKKIDSKSALTQTGTAIGTAYYMSPEQVSGKNVTHLSDIYAVGVMLYLVLTGKLPFLADYAPSLYKKILSEDPIAPCSIEEDIPKSLEHICMKCLQKNPDFRYSSANLIARDLQKYLNNKNIVIKEKNIKVLLAQTLKSKYARISLGVSAFALLAMSLFLIYSSYINKNIILETKFVENYQKAQDLLIRGNMDKAQFTLEELLKENPQASEVHLLLAHIYISKQNYIRANEYSQKALALKQSSQTFYVQCLILYKLEKYEDALVLLNKTMKTLFSSELYRLRSTIYLKMGKDSLAYKDINSANQWEEKELKPYSQDIKKYEEQKDIANVLQLYGQILNKYPNSEQIHSKRYEIYLMQGDYEKALADIGKCFELHPCFEYKIKKIKCLSSIGYLQQSLNIIENTTFLKYNEDEQLEFSRELGKIYIDLSRIDEAQQIYQKIPPPQRTIDDLLQIARIYFYTQDYDIAGDYFKQIFDLKTALSGDVYYYYTQNLYGQQKYQKALEYALGLAQKNVDSVEADFLIGKCYFKLGNLSDAYSYFIKIHNKKNNNAELSGFLGDIYLQQKKYSEAIEAYSKCIALEPWQDVYYQNRGIVYFEQKIYSRSQKDFLKVLSLNPQNYLPMEYLFRQSFETNSIKEQEENIYLMVGLSSSLYKRRSVDIFYKEKQKLSFRYFTQSTLLKLASTDINRANIFIKTLCSQDSEVVTSIAEAALLKMAHDPQVLEMLQSQIKPDLSKTKIKLLDALYKRMKRQHLEVKKTQIKALLIRYYVVHDEKALHELYHFPNHIDVLKEILIDKKEHSILRYMVTQGLYELKTMEAYDVLNWGTLHEDITVKLYSMISLIPLHRNSFSHMAEEILSVEDRFLRVLISDYLPIENLECQQVLESFLDDKDIAVRLAAAKRLWPIKNEKAGDIFIQNFSHKNTTIRSFCHLYFWDFDNIPWLKEEKIVNSLDKYLLEGIKDEEEEVQRICIQKTSQLGSSKCLQEVYNYTNSPKPLVTFQALSTIGLCGNLKLCAQIASKEGTRWIHKLPLLLAIRLNEKNKTQSMLNFLEFVNTIFYDEHSNIRMFFLRELGKITQGIGNSYLMKNLNDKDMYNRIGAMLGLANSDIIQTSWIDDIFPLLNDPEKKVKVGAAFSIITILGKKNKWKKLKKYHDIIKKMPMEIREGGAWGYAGLTLKNNQRQRFAEETGIWDEELVYGRYIERLDKHLNAQSEKDLANDEFALLSALDLSPNGASYLFEVGVCYSIQKDFEKSKEYIQKAIEIRKDFGIFKLWYAKILYELKDYDNALKVIEKGLSISPWNSNMIYSKFRLLEKLNRFEEAEKVRKRWELFFKK